MSELKPLCCPMLILALVAAVLIIWGLCIVAAPDRKDDEGENK